MREGLLKREVDGFSGPFPPFDRQPLTIRVLPALGAVVLTVVDRGNPGT
jgi:hypothetical protein